MIKLKYSYIADSSMLKIQLPLILVQLLTIDYVSLFYYEFYVLIMDSSWAIQMHRTDFKF